MIPLLLLLLQTQAGDVIVTGARLKDAQAACVKGSCTPLRDAQTSIALAEALFRDGEYLDAKRLLGAAVSRNRTHGAEAPWAVAALYEAYATTALHEGDLAVYRRATAHRAEILTKHLPGDDPSVITARVDLGDMWSRIGDYDQAERSFRAIETQALSDHQEPLAMTAGLKRAWIAAAAGRRSAAERKLDTLEQRPIARSEAFRTAITVMRLRVAALDADERRVDALVSALGHATGDAPVLVWAPPYELDTASAVNADARKFGDRPANDNEASAVAGVQWIDVGFWIRPDGRTAESEILRGSPSRGWAKNVLRQVDGRRYAPIRTSNPEGVYRIERTTLKTRYITPADSVIRRRSVSGGYEVLDLSAQTMRPTK